LSKFLLWQAAEPSGRSEHKNPQIPESLEFGEGQVRVVVRVKWLIFKRGEGGEGNFLIAYSYL
jgi:hypothetical protein